MSKRFIFDLSDERRAGLEQYRARMGLRSLAEALQSLIDNREAIIREKASQPPIGVIPSAPAIGAAGKPADSEPEPQPRKAAKAARSKPKEVGQKPAADKAKRAGTAAKEITRAPVRARGFDPITGEPLK